MKYRKKSAEAGADIEVEAVRYIPNDQTQELPQWLGRAMVVGTVYKRCGDELIVKTLEGDVTVSPGDYIVQGTDGELFACRPDVFLKSYTSVE